MQVWLTVSSAQAIPRCIASRFNRSVTAATPEAHMRAPSWLVLFTVLLLPGCFSPDDRRQWNEAMKDLNGDNMKLRNDFSSTPRKSQSQLPDE
jgi:hypothetical protein